MGAGLLLQYLAIAAAVLISAWVVANKQFPGGMRKLRIALALSLLREGRAGWLRAIGRWIAPSSRATDTACGGCNNCDPPAAGR